MTPARLDAIDVALQLINRSRATTKRHDVAGHGEGLVLHAVPLVADLLGVPPEDVRTAMDQLGVRGHVFCGGEYLSEDVVLQVARCLAGRTGE